MNAAPSTIPGGIDLAFEVTGFKNPIEAGYVDGFGIRTAIRSGSDYYDIDIYTTSLSSITEYALLSNSKLSVIDIEGEDAGLI